MITTSSREKLYIRNSVRAINAKRVLEIGAFEGKTTRVLSEEVGADGSVVVIDPLAWASRPAHLGEWLEGLLFGRYEKKFWRNVKSSPFENVHVFRGLSTDAHLIASPDARLSSFDLVFIDGEHIYETVLHDYVHWGSRVRDGGLVLLHDCVGRFPGVIRATAEIATQANARVRWPDSVSGSIATVEIQSVALPQAA